MPYLLILIPLLGLIILNLPAGNVMKRLAFFFALALFLVQIFLAVFHHLTFWNNRFEVFDTFFKVNFYVDHFSFIMLLSIGIVALAALLVGHCSITDRDERFNFINLLIISDIGMSGVVMVEDIFSLYVFLEIVAVSSFILIAFQRKKLALEGAFKYIVMSAIATIMMLSSIALIVLLSGSATFAAIKSAILSSNKSHLVVLAAGIFICGLFIKGGLVPFHGWLPDAYTSASAPVSVLLAGIVTKVSGVYTLIRIVTSLFGFTPQISSALMLIGTISILVGAFAAMGQSDFKRMLAYSSISQVGYIILGLGTGTELGIIGAIFHLFNHSIFKSLLFVNSAAVETELGTSDMNRMGGLSQRMPVAGATSMLGILSTSGIPPLAGFWSKLIIIVALWKSANYAYAVIAVLASVLTLAYLLSMQRAVFFGKLRAGLENVKEASIGCKVAAIMLAGITVGVGIFFPVVFNNLIMPVKEMLLK